MMKHFVSFVSILLIAYCYDARAQVVEKKVSESTYLVDSTNKTIENKNNKLINQILPKVCDIVVSHPKPIEDIYKKVFSEKRINELQKSSISMRYLCDSSGKILEVAFTIRGELNEISLSEIKHLEDLLKGYSFQFYGVCPEQQYYKIFSTCRFRNL